MARISSIVPHLQASVTSLSRVPLVPLARQGAWLCMLRHHMKLSCLPPNPTGDVGAMWTFQANKGLGVWYTCQIYILIGTVAAVHASCSVSCAERSMLCFRGWHLQVNISLQTGLCRMPAYEQILQLAPLSWSTMHQFLATIWIIHLLITLGLKILQQDCDICDRCLHCLVGGSVCQVQVAESHDQ